MKIIVREGVNENRNWTAKAKEIADYVVNELHLSFGNVEFRLVNTDELAQGRALYLAPLPTWYLGQTYIEAKEKMGARYESLYEMVGHKYKNTLENEEYTVVYLNKADTEAEIKSVIAHVYGHMHMNYNNYLCKKENGDLIKHAIYRERYSELERIISEDGKTDGKKKLEGIFDLAQTLETLIDLYPETRSEIDNTVKNYYKTTNNLPEETVYDVYKFILDNAQFNPWEKEVYSMMYDLAQLYRMMRTKIMHEGFASFVEKKYALYGEKNQVVATEMQLGVDQVANPYEKTQLPYALGIKLFESIEERGNKGRFGLRYSILSEEKKREFDDKSGKGLEKILDALRFSDDIGFISAYADDIFLKDYIDILKKRFPEDYAPKTKEEFDYMEWVSELTPRILKLELLIGREAALPSLEIPKGGARYVGPLGVGLLLEQNLSFLKRYIDSGELSKEETDNLWGHFTLLNHSTADSLNRLVKIWGRPVYIKTVDNLGLPCLIGGDGNKIKFFPIKTVATGISMFG